MLCLGTQESSDNMLKKLVDWPLLKLICYLVSDYQIELCDSMVIIISKPAIVSISRYWLYMKWSNHVPPK